MGVFEILMLVLGLVGVAASTGLGAYSATQNKKATEQANETNLQIARETNQANVDQANIAYQRSLPISQVSNLMAAGMSRAGALNTLTGGGSYTAPTLQGASVQPETMDLSGVTESLQRLHDIPANVQQAGIVSEQRKALAQQTAQREQMFKTDMQIKGQELLSKKLENIGTMYGQRVKRETDELANSIVDAMYNSGKPIDSFDSEQSIYDLMKDNELFKSANSVSRQNAIDIARQRKQDKNVNRAANDAHLAAQDAHDLAEYRKDIEKINVKYYDKEKHEQLLNIMRQGESLIQNNNLTFAKLTEQDLQNMILSAGIDDVRDAKALGEYINKLAQEDELDIMYKRQSANRNTLGVHNQLRVLLRDLGEILMKFKVGS